MKRKGTIQAAAGTLLALFLLAACPSPGGPDLEDGILATFDVNGERYSIFITNPQTIDQVIALSHGQSEATIPSGRVRKGRVSYNRPWSWHIDSQEIAMAEVTIELCDGTPSYLESHLDDWINTVGHFCPWSARLISVRDYR